MSDKIKEYLDADMKKLEELVEAHPEYLTPGDVASFLNVNPASVRSVLENGKIGLAWRKPGKMNHGYHLPTAQFVRWYLLQTGFAV